LVQRTRALKVSAEGFDNRNPFDIINSPMDRMASQPTSPLLRRSGSQLIVARHVGIAIMAFGTTAAAADSTFSANTSGTPLSDADWYEFTMPAGHSVLKLESSTPGDGAGQFENILDPEIKLYDSTGKTLLGSGVALPDGRNEDLTVAGLTPGSSYRVFVSAAVRPGEYFLGLARSGRSGIKCRGQRRLVSDRRWKRLTLFSFGRQLCRDAGRCIPSTAERQRVPTLEAAVKSGSGHHRDLTFSERPRSISVRWPMALHADHRRCQGVQPEWATGRQ
jgi:hypothetical protein